MVASRLLGGDFLVGELTDVSSPSGYEALKCGHSFQ